jgi:hypothetical protein
MAAQRNTDTDGTITAVAACSSAILALQDHVDSFPRLAAAAVAEVEEVYDVPSERGRIKDSHPNISRGACPWYDDYLSRTPMYDSSRFLLRRQIRGGAIHGDDLVVRTFARCTQQNRDREA